MSILNDNVINCEYISNAIKREVEASINSCMLVADRKPKLAVILAGNDKANISYVRGKGKDCEEVGISTTTYMFENSDRCEKNIIEKIKELNNDENVDGILVQLPLPKGIDEEKILNTISKKKDVDCFHKKNVANLYLNDRYDLAPCTPRGIVELLKFVTSGDLSGKKAVIVGRSNIVGKPMAKMLMDMNATVTICHSKSSEELLKKECRSADILVVAIGNPKFITSEYVKSGAIVFDVGINRDDKNKLCGDVDFDSVCKKASFITKVPKGIGLITRAFLLKNTFNLYRNNYMEKFYNKY